MRRRERANGTGLLRALLVAALLAVRAVPSLAIPSLVVEPPTIDLGILEGDVRVPFACTLRNAGDAPLRIHEVVPTCGCTVVLFTDSLIAPGDAAPLTGAFHSRKLEGNVLKSIFVKTNDPERPRAVVLLRAWVQREVTLSETSVSFGDVAPGEPGEKTILIRPAKDLFLVILGVDGCEGLVRAELSDGERAGDRILRVALLPQPEGTVLDDTLYVRTNAPGRETIPIPVDGRVRGSRK